MQHYLVSYLVWHDNYEYRRHFISLTDDFRKNLREVIGNKKGQLDKYLQAYETWGYIELDEYAPNARRLIKAITVCPLPPEDEQVLTKYMWKPVGRLPVKRSR